MGYLVSKTLAWFEKHTALNSREVMTAFLESAVRAGYTLAPDSMHADQAVIWSVLWYGRMRDNQVIYEHYRAQNKPVIVLDVGTLNRGHTWKIAVNHINAQGYYGHDHALDADRPARLGLTLQHPRSRRPEILICSQHAHSLQTQDWPSQEAWINDRLSRLKAHTDRKIIVRPHPRSAINAALLDRAVQIQVPRKLPHTYDHYDFDLNYHAVVNHNSGPGILAALAGTMPVVDATSLAHPVSYAWAALEKPYDIDRQDWLIQMSHTEYTVPEIQQGVWYPRLWSALQS